MKFFDHELLKHITEVERVNLLTFMELFDLDHLPDGAWFSMLEEGGQKWIDANPELMYRVYRALRRADGHAYAIDCNDVAHAYLKAKTSLQSIARRIGISIQGMPTEAEAKLRARHLQSKIHKEHGNRVSYNQALNLLAVSYGYPTYNALLVEIRGGKL